MSRTYLFVDPEDRAEVQGLGAVWDEATKRWYVEGELTSRFSRWLPGHEAEDYAVESDCALVASTRVTCPHCGAETEVIGIHCRTGTVMGEPLEQFTVSEIFGMDTATRELLKVWPTYRPQDPAEATSEFANHCANCAAILSDQDLHSEPGQALFDVAHAPSGAVTLTPLYGTIRLNGNERFIIE